ncbi:GNAT family N-acetyltransferase [Solimonas marina]|uniref:GNAT family N-acetyltransferase n=1 Tax=Solimonas marina TaxID=2714601 RepID=A0A969WC14_9GAMM|nr:GNAT family N-acetyltransferase [Solimonas marina]NKF22666.1 GNAT family N-acetyltransferase [Solimonas marina]
MTPGGAKVRVDDVRLIAILENGEPAFCSGEMPPAARDALEGTAALYEADGFSPPWIGYLAECGGEIVGSCAFVGPPQEHRVEIAFQTFAEHQGCGVATAVVQRLIALAAGHDEAPVLCAQTPSGESAATQVLRKQGFRLRDSLHHPQDGIVWYWEREAPLA